MINLGNMLQTKPTYLIGLMQALGVALYVLLFVTFITNFGNQVEHSSQFLAPVIFLTAFVTSALICGSLVLAYPAWLTVQNRIKDAVAIVAWTIAWLLAILIMVITLAVIY